MRKSCDFPHKPLSLRGSVPVLTVLDLGHMASKNCLLGEIAFCVRTPELGLGEVKDFHVTESHSQGLVTPSRFLH